MAICKVLLASTFLGILFVEYKSKFYKGGSEPPGFNDSLVLPSKPPSPPKPKHFDETVVPRAPEVCRKRDCVIEAAFFHANKNNEVNPCTNFYEFTCGKFRLYHNIPLGKPMFDVAGLTHERVQKQIHKSLLATSTTPEEPYEKLVKAFFQKCMDVTKIDATGKTALNEFFNKFDGGVPFLGGAGFQTSWETFFAKALKFVYVDMPIYVSLGPDPEDSTKKVPTFGQAPEFLVADPNNYAEGMQNEIVKAAKEMLVKVAVKLGATQTSAEKDVKDVLEFAMKLNAAAVPPLTAENSDSSVMLTFKELKSKYPGIAFQDIVDNYFGNYLTFTDDTRINLEQFAYFDKLTAIMAATPKKVIANIFTLKFIAQSVEFLQSDIIELFNDFANLQKGFKTKIPFNKLESCFEHTNDLLGLPMSRLYVKDHFDLDKVAPRLEEMTAYIKKYFIKELEESKWLDDSTRQNAIKKANKLRYLIGYPKIIFDDTYMRKKYEKHDPSPDNESLLALCYRLLNYRRFDAMKQINTPPPADEIFSDSVAVVNAFNIPYKNAIVYLAAILQYPYFMPDVPRYVQYGTFGSVIGHELQHGYDKRGYAFDENGNMKNWWQPDTLDKFILKKACFINQYNAEGIDGDNSAGENMADNAGLKTAFGAYKLWLEEHPDEVEMKLPGFSEYTNEQMFFISWGNIWCGLIDEETARLVRDPHPPSNIRSKVAVRNSVEFNNVFNCPKPTAQTCHQW
uniref:Peptidase_M13_N domain-containing protein n=1 Tax=Panagrellus redivivus TaxID=6233 RepID=A0A7E4VFT7_PANRE